jgi:hypothetical protein
MKYGRKSYGKILEHAIDRGYRFVDYASVDLAHEAGKQIILRHDIDLSPEMALEMAEIDASLNISSTFALLLTSPLYNALNKDNLKTIDKIHLLGHHIALHHDISADCSDEQLCKDINIEMKILKELLPYIKPVFVWHDLPPNSLFDHIEVPGMINAYAAKFTKKMHYMSDSVTRHSPEDFLNALGKYELLHLLLHPIIWMSERDDMVSMLACEMIRKIRHCDRTFRGNRAWKEKYPHGIQPEILQRLEDWLVNP